MAMPLSLSSNTATGSGPAGNSSRNVNASGGTSADLARLAWVAFGAPTNGGEDFEAPDRVSTITRADASLAKYVPFLVIIGVAVYLWKRS